MSSLANRLHVKDFRLIRTICETGQLALAAERLGMTQPAASRMLAAIEEAIGLKLFDRHPKGMSPTPAGEVLARNALTLVNGIDQAVREVEAVRSGRAGTVRVGAVTGGAVAFVVPAIRELKQKARGADIHVDVAPSDELINGLIRGDFDFVLSRVPPGVDARQFSIRRGRVEIIRFLVRAGHPLAAKPMASLADLASHEWVVQAPHTPLRQAIEEALASRQVAPPAEIVNTTSLLVMLAYLASSDAIAPISREVAGLLGSEGIGGNLVPLDLEEPVVVNAYHLITRRGETLSPLASSLCELVFAGLSGG